MTDWPTLRLAELTTKVGSGATPRGGEKSYKESGIPLIRSQNIHFGGLVRDGLAFIDDQQASKLDNVTVEEADVLLNITGASIGRVCTAPPEMDGARVNQHVCIIRPVREKLLPEFLELFLSTPTIQRFIDNTESGATRQALTKGKILDFEVPVPPLPIQRDVISNSLAQRARIETAFTALERLPNLIEKFRQSVLAAAFRGDLTKEWREQNPDVEPASVLLERIRAERRERWIEDAAEKGRAKAEAKAHKAGKPWTDEDDEKVLTKELVKAAKKYKEPEPVDASGLPELPETWCWATIDEIAYSLDYGTSRKSSLDGAVPVLRMGNIQRGEIDWTDLKYTPDPEEIEKYRLERDTVLFNRTNSPALVGKSAIFRGERQAIFAGYLIRIRQVPSIMPDWLAYSLNSPWGRSWCSLVKTDGVSQSNISASKLATFRFPLAPLDEQRHAAARVAKLLEATAASESRVQIASDDLARLEQSLLASVFGQQRPSTNRSKAAAASAPLAEPRHREFVESATELLSVIARLWPKRVFTSRELHAAVDGPSSDAIRGYLRELLRQTKRPELKQVFEPQLGVGFKLEPKVD